MDEKFLDSCFCSFEFDFYTSETLSGMETLLAQHPGQGDANELLLWFYGLGTL